ncbi:TonB-dependent receptor [Paracoccus sp. SSJ]|uniref:TonB-dependent receptor domain-containing protein n=1 Tax=Paracoccus sp. SSJ TaxID=3050636 RepID=UPI00254B01A2|nr:TonB-dependent receptor [Paracoccus sp. SSJ]MDK8873216.1 TonB-dependent receptor [Paracoccus sp. SSJ]
MARSRGSARAELEASDELRFVLGDRYGSYKYSSITEVYQVDGMLTSRSVTGYEDRDIFTPYAAVVYDLSDDWTVYASLMDIYKAQANYLSGLPETPRPLDPITGRNYELGVKGCCRAAG